MKDVKNVVIMILAIGVLVLLVVNSCNRSKLMETVIDNSALLDTIQSHKNKEGELVSSIKVFQANEISTITKIKTKDSTIIQLQDDLARNKKLIKQGGSVSIIHTVTNAYLSDTIHSREDTTIIRNDTVFVYPEYQFTINKFGEWITGKGVVNKDSIDMNIHLKHDYSLVIGTEGHGLFKRRTPYAELTNKNPYDSTTALRVANIVLPKTRTKAKIGAGIIIGTILGYLLWH